MVSLRARTNVAVCAVLLSACAADPPAAGDFQSFWRTFREAVMQDDEDGVRSLTRFPFLFEGESRGVAEFESVYAALFDDRSRLCFSSGEPIADDETYQLSCGPILYVFGRDAGTWRFTEFAADPEAEVAPGDGAGSMHSAGAWRVVRRFAAPWAREAVVGGGSDLEGATVRFDEGRVNAPAPLGCEGAEYAFLISPAEGLFQGRIPERAQSAARDVGVVQLPVLTLRVDCDTGSFDYHYIGRGALLTALDNAVWRLESEEPAGAAHLVVLEMLREHMTGDMAFTPGSVESKRGFLSARLYALATSYFAGLDATEPPPINGDPFTDSQEYPDRFQLGGINTAGAEARVEVVYTDGYRRRSVTMVLRQVGGAWLIDDIEYERGTTLREELTG